MIEDFKKDFKNKGTAYIKEGFHPLKKSELTGINFIAFSLPNNLNSSSATSRRLV